MEYIAGDIAEIYQRSHYYEILNEFTFAILDNARERDLQRINDWEDLTYTIDLKVGDILCIRFFKARQTSIPYAYLDFHITDGEKIDIKQETIMSKEFIDLNSFIFDNVTKQYERNLKIEQIL